MDKVASKKGQLMPSPGLSLFSRASAERKIALYKQLPLMAKDETLSLARYRVFVARARKQFLPVTVQLGLKNSSLLRAELRS